MTSILASGLYRADQAGLSLLDGRNPLGLSVLGVDHLGWSLVMVAALLNAGVMAFLSVVRKGSSRTFLYAITVMERRSRMDEYAGVLRCG